MPGFFELGWDRTAADDDTCGLLVRLSSVEVPANRFENDSHLGGDPHQPPVAFSVLVFGQQAEFCMLLKVRANTDRVQDNALGQIIRDDTLDREGTHRHFFHRAGHSKTAHIFRLDGFSTHRRPPNIGFIAVAPAIRWRPIQPYYYLTDSRRMGLSASAAPLTARISPTLLRKIRVHTGTQPRHLLALRTRNRILVRILGILIFTCVKPPLERFRRHLERRGDKVASGVFELGGLATLDMERRLRGARGFLVRRGGLVDSDAG
ncbi:hypothetical protein DFH06DRAFT_1375918 [Mycena polygramma]|nr:hypothetical protein DFH06DRAFT_1375918 [Mycena polygramma]